MWNILVDGVSGIGPQPWSCTHGGPATNIVLRNFFDPIVGHGLNNGLAVTPLNPTGVLFDNWVIGGKRIGGYCNQAINPNANQDTIYGSFSGITGWTNNIGCNVEVIISITVNGVIRDDLQNQLVAVGSPSGAAYILKPNWSVFSYGGTCTGTYYSLP
jgi:hypothetical protein